MIRAIAVVIGGGLIVVSALGAINELGYVLGGALALLGLFFPSRKKSVIVAPESTVEVEREKHKQLDKEVKEIKDEAEKRDDESKKLLEKREKEFEENRKHSPSIGDITAKLRDIRSGSSRD